MKRLYLLYTGGTLGMLTRGDAVVSPRPLAEVCQLLPDWQVDWLASDEKQVQEQSVVELGTVQLADIDSKVTLGSTQKPIDSSSMNLTHWRLLFDCIARRYQSYDGFVIIHGTDTMAYTASALSFACAGLNKPIVLTGAQVPIDQASSDARNNLDNALQVAATGSINEVVISFGSSVVRGCRAVKSSTVSYDAFVSPARPAIASLNPLRVNAGAQQSLTTTDKDGFAIEDLAEGVELCWLHPGMNVLSCIQQLQGSSAQAIVLACFGDAHIPEDARLIQAFKSMSDAGVILVTVSQCLHHPHTGVRYAISEVNTKAGVIDGGDATFEATLTKLMWALANCHSTNQIRKVMTDTIRGERSI